MVLPQIITCTVIGVTIGIVIYTILNTYNQQQTQQRQSYYQEPYRRENEIPNRRGSTYNRDTCAPTVRNRRSRRYKRRPSSEEVCCICHEKFEQDLFPLGCGHFLHEECFRKLTKDGNAKCPLCRYDIKLSVCIECENEIKSKPILLNCGHPIHKKCYDINDGVCGHCW